MNFKLRKKTGVNGTEISLSVSFSPEETSGLDVVNDDPNIHPDKLRIPGTEYQRADHALMALRILVHHCDLWAFSQINPAIAQHVYRGVRRKELQEETKKLRKKRRRK